SNMPRKRTRAPTQIDKTQNKFHCEEAKLREQLQRLYYHIHQAAEALNWELFDEKRPSVDEKLAREFYANLTSNELTEVPVHEIKVPITSNAINEFFELPNFKNNEYSSLLSNIKPKNLQEILEELTVPGSKWTMSKQGIHTCRREYLTPLAKTIDVGKIILREMRNCTVRCSSPAYFPFTITILCLKAKILANRSSQRKKISYSNHGVHYRRRSEAICEKVILGLG
ncbi:hypothetical protein J1N35_005270, partial [Gossypium stocksii]